MSRFFNYLLQTRLFCYAFHCTSFGAGFVMTIPIFLIWHLNLQLTHLGMCYFDTIFPSLIPGSQWIFQIHLGFFKFKFQISLPVFNSKLTHSSRCWKPRTRKGKKFCYKYKDDLRLLLKGWSEHIKLYPEMFELSSSKAVVEWRYVSDKKIFSNVLIAI